MFKTLRFLFILTSFAVLVACSQNDPPPSSVDPAPFIGPVRTTEEAQTLQTPDPPEDTPEPTPTLGPAFTEYTVRRGDTLGVIADKYRVNMDDIAQMNGLANPHALQVGQVLRIPVQVDKTGPSDKLVPDSEVVYGPSYENFDVNAFAKKYGGYLVGYQERVEGKVMTGPDIIRLIAERFSVGPRVLLTILELQGGWVTSSALSQTQLNYPLGYLEPSKSGLYKQGFWIASFLNEGYYGKLTGSLTAFEFPDRRRARLAAGVNPGTAAIQNALAHEAVWDAWVKLLSPEGFRGTYQKLFGDPFQYEVKPLVPRDLKQPTLRLPFPDGHLWYFTGGPHAGWVDGSAWAAIDFTPKDQAGSCWTSADWNIAAAPGKIVSAENGRVMENISGFNFQGRGWTLMYMHTADEDRAEVGTELKTGDHIGHPSCTGGAAETSHLHFGRLYNGQWIPAADPKIPMVLSGWVVQGDTQEYDGKMVRGAESHVADDAQVPDKNGIIADAGK